MDFIREQIKEKPISKKRLATKIGVAALCGLVFALVVCIVLVIAVPVLKEKWDAEAAVSDTESETNHVTEEAESQGETLVIPSTLSLSISDYQTLQNELYNIGNEVGKSIVTVTNLTSDADWAVNNFEKDGQGSGAIISEDDNYIYILVEKKIISDAASIRVTFTDGTGADATMLKYDGNTGLAILTVEKRQLTAETKAEIQAAKMGSSNEVTNGSIVIAVGSPLGTGSSILTGNITSVENEVMMRDQNYSVFTTDIVASENGSGFLINTSGEIIGVVMQAFRGLQNASTLTAVAESEISGIIENLKNGKDVPYIGIYISTVTDDIAEDYGLPKGVFIKEVATDSPAMEAGIQNGDVITHINGEEVLTDDLYSDKISQLIPGTTCELSVKRQNGDTYYDVVCLIEIGVLE